MHWKNANENSRSGNIIDLVQFTKRTEKVLIKTTSQVILKFNILLLNRSFLNLTQDAKYQQKHLNWRNFFVGCM